MLFLCQYGGFSKFPGELPDLYHSYYGYTAFSLLEEPGLNALYVELGMTDIAAFGIWLNFYSTFNAFAEPFEFVCIAMLDWL